MKLTLFCVSITSGLLHTFFQNVSVHPIPIQICYGLLSDASGMQRILTHFLSVFVCRGWVHPVSVTMHFPPIPLFCFLSVPSVRQRRLPFCDMILTLLVYLFLCLHYSGLLHDVFQRVSVHPIPIEFCHGLLSDAFDETNSFGVTLLVSSLFCGLLHDVFQIVSAHPHPHWNLLWNVQRHKGY